jgi:hypothetical protein
VEERLMRIMSAIGNAPRRRESSVDEESTRGCRLLHLETFPPVPVIQDVVIEPMATKNGRQHQASLSGVFAW